MGRDRLTVLVDAPVSADERGRIAAVPGVARVLTLADLAEDPALVTEVDVLFASAQPGRAFDDAPRLAWVQTFGAGVERLLAEPWARRPGLVVTNARGIHAQAIAEHVFAFLLGHTRDFARARRDQQQRVWRAPGGAGPIRSLAGASLGVLGPGAIGQRVAELGRAFGMRVVGYRRKLEPLPYFDELYRGEELERFLGRSEYLVNILPSTAHTRGFLGARELALLPEGAYLVNVGRGDTLDTDALLAALARGHLAGAGLDVTHPEPLPAGHPLWAAPGVTITSHYAGAHPSYERDATDVFIDNLRRYVARGKLRNEVDRTLGY